MEEEPVYEPIDHGARVIGECFRTYIIAEDEDGLLLIDKHAAHERILFNKLRAETEIPQQQLLTPVVVELTGEEAAAVQAQLEDIRKAGFSIDRLARTALLYAAYRRIWTAVTSRALSASWPRKQ